MKSKTKQFTTLNSYDSSRLNRDINYIKYIIKLNYDVRT